MSVCCQLEFLTIETWTGKQFVMYKTYILNQSSYQALSNNTKVSDCLTFTMTFMLKVGFWTCLTIGAL